MDSHRMNRRPHKRDNSRVLMFTPHPQARPCRRCRIPVDPGDIAYVRGFTGSNTVVCISCLRALEAEIRHAAARPERTAIEKVEQQVRDNPRLASAPAETAKEDALRLERLAEKHIRGRRT